MTIDKQRTLRARQMKALYATAITYRKVFESEDGQRVLRDLMRRFHMIRSVTPDEELKMAFKEGERNVVLYILSQMKTDILSLQKLIEESHDNVTTDHTIT